MHEEERRVMWKWRIAIAKSWEGVQISTLFLPLYAKLLLGNNSFNLRSISCEET